MTKARDIADFKFENIVDTGTEGTKVASGTTAQRGSTTGQLRFNSTTGLAEYYDGTQFKSIDSPPTISSISPTTETDANSNIVITGSNFSSGATVKFIGNDGTEYASPSVTVNSTTQITATTPASPLTVANEPYDVQVTNTSGLSGVLADALDAGSSPTWTTAAGNIGTVIEDEAVSSLSVAATDADGQSVSITSSDFSIAGLTLATSGAITGTPNVNDTYNSNGVTHSFNAVASDGVNTTSRAFNILRKWPDGSSSSAAGNSALQIKNLTNTTTSGLYYINVSGQGAVQTWCDMSTDGGGWTLVFKYHNYNANNFVWPNSNTYYAMPAGDPRSSTYGQTNGNLPNKYSDYGSTSTSNATHCLFEQYDYSDGNASYIYRGTFTSTIGSAWQSGTWSGNYPFMPASMSQTQIVDRCSSNAGTRPTTDSHDSNYFNDKASPGSGGNWDIGGMVSGSGEVGKQGANCGRHGESGPGSHRSASVLIWVK